MQYWLVKSEPFEYSFADLVRDGRTAWTGVRNYQARNNLRRMKVGDRVLYYHSRKGLEIVGIAEVAETAFPDPTAEKGDWSAVSLIPLRVLNQTVSLQSLKQDPAFAELALVRNPRLSVMPVAAELYERIMLLAGE